MNLENKILFLLSKRVIQKNIKFKNLHKGESCYLFGNGASIKYYNLEEFGDKISIGCNGLFFHSHFNKINVQYYLTPAPFFYYPYWRNSLYKNVEKNIYGASYKDKIRLYKNVSFFASLSNYFGLKSDNLHYYHHFGKTFTGFSDCRLEQYFTSVDSAIHGMLGLAIYMGFKDVTLIGCDYAFSPRGQGHFYSYGRFPDSFEEPHNEKNYRAAQEHLKIRVLTPNDDYKGDILPEISYEELTGMRPDYKENYEIVSKADLLMLHSLNHPNSRRIATIIFPKDNTL